MDDKVKEQLQEELRSYINKRNNLLNTLSRLDGAVVAIHNVLNPEQRQELVPDSINKEMTVQAPDEDTDKEDAPEYVKKDIDKDKE